MSSIAIAGSGGSSGRTILLADRTYFVRTTGSDSNDGLTAGTAFATLQHAMVVIATLDFGAFFVTVDIGAGTFVGVDLLATVGGGILQWNGAGPSNTTIKAANQSGCFNLNNETSTTVGVNDVTFNNLGAIATNALVNIETNGIFVLGDAKALIGGVGTIRCNVSFVGNFLASDIAINASNTGGQIFTSNNDLTANITVNGSFLWIIALDVNGLLEDGAQWVMSGGPSFSVFAEVNDNSQLVEFSGTFTGAATGKRFEILNGSQVSSGGAGGLLGPTKFPGSTAGTADSTSAYDGFRGPLPGINTQTVNYTLGIGDIFGTVEMNLAGANTVTVPLNATTAFEIGTIITIVQAGAGATTVQGAGGVTVDNSGTLAAQWSKAQLYKRGTNEWVMVI